MKRLVQGVLVCAPLVSVFGQAPARPRFTIVTMGDSYASGEAAPERHGQYNAPDFKTGTPEIWTVTNDAAQAYLARRCHRSPRSTSGVAAESLKVRYPEIDVTFLSFACSGAKITDGILGKYEGVEQELKRDSLLWSQIDQLNAHFKNDPTRTVDALVLNIGGNDALFAAIVANCLIVPLEIAGCQNNPLTGQILKAFDSLPARYARIDDALKGRGSGPVLNARLRPSAVYTTEYPDPTHGGPPGSGTSGNPANYCYRGGASDPLYNNTNPAEAKFIHDSVVMRLNARVRSGAQNAGWTYVAGPMEGAYAHGMCAPDSWFRTNQDALRFQGADAIGGPVSFGLSAGTVHPNEAGYRAMAQYLLQQLDAQLRRRFGGTTLAVDAPRLTVESSTPGLATVAVNPALATRTATREAAVIPQGVASGRITIRWTDPIPGGARTFVLENNGETKQLPSGTTSYTITGSGRFKVRVKACGGLLCSPVSPDLVVSNVVPGVPNDLRKATAPGTTTFAGTLALAWTYADDFAEYAEIEYRPASGSDASPRPLGGSAPVARAPSSAAATAYQTVRATTSPTQLGAANAPLGSGLLEVRARACSSAGCSAFTAPLIATPGAAPGSTQPPRP